MYRITNRINNNTMGLKNTLTNEYLKIDFGYLPLPTAKIFRTQAARQNFDANFDSFKKQEFNVTEFNTVLKTAVTDPLKPLLMDNFKSVAYSFLKEILNRVTADWEDC